MGPEERKTCHALRELLCDVVEKNSADALLLSGGLDTSILAAVSGGKCGKAFTVSMNGAPDLEYARKVAEMFHYDVHHIIEITENEALEIIPEVIKALRTFDEDSIPNDIAIYFALQEAKELGIERVMTGDGADELFAGYSFMHDMNAGELEKYIKNISKVLYFSSNKLSAFFGIEIKQPYLDKKIIDFALNIDPSMKVKKIGDKSYGKWLLRKAFEKELKEIAWREKTPIELGAGTTKLRNIIKSRISDNEFIEKKKRYKIDFVNKEHLFFYEIYKQVVGEVPEAKTGNACPRCGAEFPDNRFYCDICGFWALPLD